jgi:hypothetical protein
MLNLPPTIMKVLMPFAPLFHTRTWRKVPILLMGTILTPGKRTVAAALRVMGLKNESRSRSFIRCSTGLPGRPWRDSFPLIFLKCYTTDLKTSFTHWRTQAMPNFTPQQRPVFMTSPAGDNMAMRPMHTNVFTHDWDGAMSIPT